MLNNTPITTPEASNSESFLKTSTVSDSANPYGDFFQETSDGNISIGTRAQKSWLEIATWILTYIIPIALILAIIGAINVFLRTQETNAIAENYKIICPLLKLGVETEEQDCKTLKMIEADYNNRITKLQWEIITWLTEYIPIKISKNIIDASPEKAFIINTYENKVYVDEIMKQFERIRTSSTYWEMNNIECNGISITNWDTLSTQCTIYGGPLGIDDQNNRLGSARIEALSFLDELSNTSKSQFILLNPPRSLNVELILAGDTAINPLFETKTIIQIQVRYVPFNKNLN
jgi:hypothetical protein